MHNSNASSARTFTTGHTPEHVAVLGGGITGLSAAAMAAKLHPDAKVTVYESSDRLGGWVQSEVVETSDGPVIFEQGLRSLRPGTTRGYHVLSMAQNLGLEKDMLFSSSDSPAGTNRFVYYPDKLVRVPNLNDSRLEIGWRLLTDPMFEGLARSVWEESNVPRRPDGLLDESIGGFIRRRSGGNRKLVDNLVSAVVHGIYAGDVNQLSMRSLMPSLWEMEGKYGSLTMGMVGERRTRQGGNKTPSVHQAGVMAVGPQLGEKARNASIYTFRGGMQTLPNALAKVVRGSSNAEIKIGTTVSGISRSEDGETIKVCAPFPYLQ